MAKKLEIVRITPTPPVHEAVLVTDKNFRKVAEWLHGDVTVAYLGGDPVYTFRYPEGGGFYGAAGELHIHAGLYIVKPARLRDGTWPKVFTLGAVAYETFFQLAYEYEKKA